MSITISQFARVGKIESQPPYKDQKAPQLPHRPLHPAPRRPPDVVLNTRVLKPLALHK